MWERCVREWVPYHPAGRHPESKIINPSSLVLPSAALPGEHALLEALAACHTPLSRWAWLYDEDPAGLDARYSDPSDLGEAYQWSWFGPGASWDTLAAWGAGDTSFRGAIRRMVPDRFVLFAGRADRLTGPSVLEAIAAELPDSVMVPWGTQDLAAPINTVCQAPNERVILVAEEAAIAELLRMLVDHTDVRDRVSAVLSVGGVIGGRSDEEGRYSEAVCRDWLGAHFTQGSLDTEVVRLTPYLAIQWLDRHVWPPGTSGMSLAAARFPEPRSDVPIDTIESVDLGLLPSDRPIPVEIAAKAIITTIIGFVRSRR